MDSCPAQPNATCAVRALVLQERYFKDTAQWARWRECYHSDASQTRIETVWYGCQHYQRQAFTEAGTSRIEGTIDDFVLGSRKMSGAIFSRHLIQPVDAQIVQDRALIVSYGHVLLRASPGPDAVEYDVFAWGWWYHRARLVAGSDHMKAWKLTSLRFVYDRDSIMPTEPAGHAVLPKIEFDADSRPSYKYLGWVLKQVNYPVSSDLAGTDRPDTVLNVREQEETWLSSGF